jgi:hypothetical protein
MSYQDEVEALHLEILLRFNARHCRNPRRCAKVRCRRCVARAQLLRFKGGRAPKPPRRTAFRRENLLERVQSA